MVTVNKSKGRPIRRPSLLLGPVVRSPFYTETTLSAATIRFAVSLGFVNLAFMLWRWASVTPRATEQPPQT